MHAELGVLSTRSLLSLLRYQAQPATGSLHRIWTGNMLYPILLLSAMVVEFSAAARNVTNWERQDISYRLSVSTHYFKQYLCARYDFGMNTLLMIHDQLSADRTWLPHLYLVSSAIHYRLNYWTYSHGALC